MFETCLLHEDVICLKREGFFVRVNACVLNFKDVDEGDSKIGRQRMDVACFFKSKGEFFDGADAGE